MISFQLEKTITLEEFIQVLDESGLGKRRPMHDPDQLHKMIIGSNLIITARSEGRLVGVLRGMSDFCYRSFIADLAVSVSYQKQGIGRRLLIEARKTAPGARLILFAAENAISFYDKLGFHLHERCYQLKPDDELVD